jgi:hypothetical protein
MVLYNIYLYHNKLFHHKYSNILLLLLLTCIVSQTRSCPDFIPMLPYISLNGYTSSSGSEIHP